MFGVGVVPAVAAFFIRRRLAEPELFLEARPVAPFRLFAGPGMARVSLGMIVLRSVQLPSYLSGRFGYGLTQSALWTAVTIAGMAIGIASFGQVADRVGRRPAFLAWMAGAAIMVVVYATLTSPLALLVGGAVMGFFVNGMLGEYGALMSELYPTGLRATAQNVLFNIGCAVGGFGPAVVGWAALWHGLPAAIGGLAVRSRLKS